MKTKTRIHSFLLYGVLFITPGHLCFGQSWVDTSLNNATGQLQTEGNKLILTSNSNTDFFIEPAGAYEKSNAPLLLRRIDNTKPFTFTVKLSPEHKCKYDAGMAFLFVDERHWVKFAFEADEYMHTRIVTVKTDMSSDDNNHETVKQSTVSLKISSDTRQIGFYYSIDDSHWNLVRVFKNQFPAGIFIGIGTQSPAGKGNKTVFQEIKFQPVAVKDFRAGI